MENIIEQNNAHILQTPHSDNMNSTRSSNVTSARDRLLAALKSSPSLQDADAELIDGAVCRAREASLIAEISA